MTELELRQRVVDVMKGWLGWSEKNGKFKAIIDLYNTQKPLPVGYRMKYTDEWCAATVTAAGMEAGLHDIILGECSCSRMIALYQKKGQWMENDAYRPQIGDILMYDWNDTGVGENKGAPEHVGVVGAVNGNTMTIYEGNKGEAVATRTLQVNGRYIRGYCLPDYASKAESEDDMTQEQFNNMMDVWLAGNMKKAPSEWAKAAWQEATQRGLFDGTAPQNPLTREQAALLLDRLGKL